MDPVSFPSELHRLRRMVNNKTTDLYDDQIEMLDD